MITGALCIGVILERKYRVYYNLHFDFLSALGSQLLDIDLIMLIETRVLRASGNWLYPCT